MAYDENDEEKVLNMQRNIRVQAELMQRHDLLRDRKQRMTAMNNMISEFEDICDDINNELKMQGEQQINPLAREMDEIYNNTQLGRLQLVDKLKREQKSNQMVNYCFTFFLIITLILSYVVYHDFKKKYTG